MNWRNHLIFTVLILVGGYAIFGYQPSALFVAVALVATLLPDIDQENSKITTILRAIALLSILTVTYYYYGMQMLAGIPTFLLATAVLAGVCEFLYRALKPNHRGITHTILVYVFMVIPIYLYVGADFALAFAVGVLSHLCADKVCDITGIGG